MGKNELNAAVARLADGDRAAFDSVFEDVWAIVQRFCEKSLGSRADSEDAAQAAMLKIFHRAYQYDRTRDALPWILTIAAFECRTLLQQKRRRREDFAGENTPEIAVETGVEANLIVRDEMEKLDAVIGGLKPADREVILSVLNDEERPAISPATFRKRLERSMTRLKEMWRTEHVHES